MPDAVTQDEVPRVRFLPCLIVVTTVAVLMPAAVRAQFEAPETEPTKGVRYGEATMHRYRAGVVIQAVGGPCRNLYITLPVPTEWPEQEVKIVDEDFSPGVRHVRHRTNIPGVKQMLVSVPSVAAGQTVEVLVTYEITRRPILPPEDTSIFEIPPKLDRRMLPYLATGIYIEPRNPQIKALAKEVTVDKGTAWEQVEALYEATREKVEHRTTEVRKGAARALRDGYAGNNDLTALFVALCRSIKVPARTVWVSGHCYAEFYLQDDEGNGHWIPCQVTGTAEFGQSSTLRTILQKGDSFRVPEKREQLPFVREFVHGKGGRPRVKFLREALDAA
jgi:hypothetical protein